MNVQVVLRELKAEKATIQNQINQLDSALSALSGLNGFGGGGRPLTFSTVTAMPGRDYTAPMPVHMGIILA